MRADDLVPSKRLGRAAKPRKESAGERLGTALELFEAGVAMKRARLREKHPRASPRTIERKLAEWLADKPPPDFSKARWRRRPKRR